MGKASSIFLTNSRLFPYVAAHSHNPPKVSAFPAGLDLFFVWWVGGGGEDRVREKDAL